MLHKRHKGQKPVPVACLVADMPLPFKQADDSGLDYIRMAPLDRYVLIERIADYSVPCAGPLPYTYIGPIGGRMAANAPELNTGTALSAGLLLLGSLTVWSNRK
jgi:hypothetical protein